MLQVQSYLRSGKKPSDLKLDFAIDYRTSDGLVIFNYNQIESPKSHPIVMECRSLILEEGSWDIVSMAFYRFFNYGEGSATSIDLLNAYATEKIDGSIVHYFWHRGKRMFSTRSMIGGVGPTNILGTTFKDVFDLVLRKYPLVAGLGNDGFNYVFELVSPFTTVVRPYPDHDIYLLTARDMLLHEEADLEKLDELAGRLGVKMPKRYRFDSLDEVARMARDLPEAAEEGYVCTDYSRGLPNGSHYRIKVKNPAYVALAHIRDAATSTRAIVELVWHGNEDELLTYFPYFKPQVDEVKSLMEPYIAKVEAELDDVCTRFDLSVMNADKKVRAEYAAAVKGCLNKGYLFECAKAGRKMTFREYLDHEVERLKSGKGVVTDRSARKHVARGFMDNIGLRQHEAGE
jgi:hypothetical protein